MSDIAAQIHGMLEALAVPSLREDAGERAAEIIKAGGNRRDMIINISSAISSDYDRTQTALIADQLLEAYCEPV